MMNLTNNFLSVHSALGSRSAEEITTLKEQGETTPRRSWIIKVNIMPGKNRKFRNYLSKRKSMKRV